jgi:hypothetical protein
VDDPHGQVLAVADLLGQGEMAVVLEPAVEGAGVGEADAVARDVPRFAAAVAIAGRRRGPGLGGLVAVEVFPDAEQHASSLERIGIAAFDTILICRHIRISTDIFACDLAAVGQDDRQGAADPAVGGLDPTPPIERSEDVVEPTSRGPGRDVAEVAVRPATGADFLGAERGREPVEQHGVGRVVGGGDGGAGRAP